MPSKTYCITTNKATNQQQNYHQMHISKQKYTNQLLNLLSLQHTCLSFAAPGTKLDNDKPSNLNLIASDPLLQLLLFCKYTYH